MIKYFTITLLCLFLFACDKNTAIDNTSPLTPISTKAERDSIIEKYVANNPYGVYSMDRQRYLDEGLAKDSTIAHLWQQKAMPLYKQGKYQAGLPFLNKAAKYDPVQYQPYRAFMRCIFSKEYREAIIDFEDCINKFGNSIIQDHSYSFYIGISHLQLNQFKEAEKIFDDDITSQLAEHGEDWVHYLDWFYQGIAKYELKKYDEAIAAFDKSLKDYPKFAEGQYYKALILYDQGEKETAKAMYKKAVADGKEGFSTNDDNAIYEKYPYQMRWKNY